MSAELKQLKSDFKQHRTESDERWECVLAAQEENTKAVQELTESTQGIVQLYNDLQGAVRLGTGLQKFAIWLAKFGVVGGALAGLITWFFEHFPLD